MMGQLLYQRGVGQDQQRSQALGGLGGSLGSLLGLGSMLIPGVGPLAGLAISGVLGGAGGGLMGGGGGQQGGMGNLLPLMLLMGGMGGGGGAQGTISGTKAGGYTWDL